MYKLLEENHIKSHKMYLFNSGNQVNTDTDNQVVVPIYSITFFNLLPLTKTVAITQRISISLHRTLNI